MAATSGVLGITSMNTEHVLALGFAVPAHIKNDSPSILIWNIHNQTSIVVTLATSVDQPAMINALAFSGSTLYYGGDVSGIVK